MENKFKVKVLVCCHKPGGGLNDRRLSNDAYMPIQGGKAISDIDLGIQGDDTGDNISGKNKRYCETTVLYWAWKNLKNVEYIGLEHYRRRFKTEITADNIDWLMKGKDFILVRPLGHPVSVADFWRPGIGLDDFAIFIDTILGLYPDYRKDIIRYFYNNNRNISFHMFVTRWEEFDRYCNFLFSILFEAERRIRPANYTRQNRSLAFMGECLLGLYCMHNKKKVKYMEFEGEGQYPSNPIVRALIVIRNNLALKMRRPVHGIFPRNDVILGLRQDGIYLRNIEESK